MSGSLTKALITRVTQQSTGAGRDARWTIDRQFTGQIKDARTRARITLKLNFRYKFRKIIMKFEKIL